MEMSKGSTQYRLLLLMVVLSFASMYMLMYAMVDSFPDVLTNRNQLYMAGLMTAPMIVIELLLMKAMYSNTRWNVLILGASVLVGVACFGFIRQQVGITDKQFLRSMIPHHGGAILMCGKAHLQDTQIRELCRNIVANQRAEIAQMKILLLEHR